MVRYPFVTFHSPVQTTMIPPFEPRWKFIETVSDAKEYKQPQMPPRSLEEKIMLASFSCMNRALDSMRFHPRIISASRVARRLHLLPRSMRLAQGGECFRAAGAARKSSTISATISIRDKVSKADSTE